MSCSIDLNTWLTENAWLRDFFGDLNPRRRPANGTDCEMAMLRCERCYQHIAGNENLMSASFCISDCTYFAHTFLLSSLYCLPFCLSLILSIHYCMSSILSYSHSFYSFLPFFPHTDFPTFWLLCIYYTGLLTSSSSVEVLKVEQPAS